MGFSLESKVEVITSPVGTMTSPAGIMSSPPSTIYSVEPGSNRMTIISPIATVQPSQSTSTLNERSTRISIGDFIDPETLLTPAERHTLVRRIKILSVLAFSAVGAAIVCFVWAVKSGK